MNKNNISGDSKIVCGTPVPENKENGIDIPPKTAGEKAIEAGEIILSVEPNTKELINKLEVQKAKKEGIEH